MTLSPQIVNSTLSLKTTFTVGHTGITYPNNVVILDNSNWASIVSSSTDKVNIILQIVDPSGVIVYQNINWIAGTFGSPDLFYGTSPITNTPANQIFNDSNGNLITGTFSVNAKVQVIQNFATSPIITLGAGGSTPTLNSAYLQRILSPEITFTPNYFNANMVVADTTDYGDFTSIVRQITVIPPFEANQSAFIAASNSVLVTGLWAPAPYQANLSNIVTYVSGLTMTVSYILYYQNETTLNEIDLCPLYCCMKDLIVRRDKSCGRDTPEYERLTRIIQEGELRIVMCEQAVLCSDGPAVSKYIAQFYDITNCTCCDDCNATPTPIVPISPSQGPAGPTGSTGANGAPGTNGANGSNGSSYLWPPYVLPVYTWDGSAGSTGNNYVSNTILANTLSVGDAIRFKVSTSVPEQGGGFIELTIAGIAISGLVTAISANTAYCITEILAEYSSTNIMTLATAQTFYQVSSTNSSAAQVESGGQLLFGAQTIAFNPAIDQTFELFFENATAPCNVSLIEAEVIKVP